MKKYLSVFYLIARESMYKILILLFVSSVIQSNVFVFTAENAGADQLFGVSDIFDQSKVQYIFFASFIIMALILCKTGMQFSSKSGYTLRRLRITEKSVFALQSLYNLIIIAAVVCFELILCFILSEKGISSLPEKLVTHQSIYMAFYRVEFLQNMFSGLDIARSIRNFITGTALAVNFSAFPYLSRRGKKWIPAILVTAVLLIYAAQLSALAFDIAMTVIMIIFTAVSVIWVIKEEKYEA